MCALDYVKGLLDVGVIKVLSKILRTRLEIAGLGTVLYYATLIKLNWLRELCLLVNSSWFFVKCVNFYSTLVIRLITIQGPHNRLFIEMMENVLVASHRCKNLDTKIEFRSVTKWKFPMRSFDLEKVAETCSQILCYNHSKHVNFPLRNVLFIATAMFSNF